MAVNKVIYYGEVLVDMSQVTVTPESLEAGKTALDASGELITGEAVFNTEPELEEITVTPGQEEQYITAGEGYYGIGTVTVEGDENLLPQNIKDGVSIFGVTGSYKGSGGGSTGGQSCEVEFWVGAEWLYLVYTDSYDGTPCVETPMGAGSGMPVNLSGLPVGSFVVVYSFGELDGVTCTNAELYSSTTDYSGGIITTFLIHGNAIITDK